MSKLTAAWLAQTLGLPKPDRDFTFDSISTDSRTITKDQCFLAIQGDAFDGHDFIDQVVCKGVQGVITQKPVNHPIWVGQVKDSVTAYRQVASAWAANFKIPTIAVAGSVGKTTTKEILAHILKHHFKNVLKTEGSENGFVGIPKTMMRLNTNHKAAVIEVGIDDLGNMQQHLALVKPQTAIVTAIAEEHLEQMKSLENVAREELMALDYVLTHGGTAIANLEDPWTLEWLKKQTKKEKVLGFCMQGSSNPTRAVTVEMKSAGRVELRLGVDEAFIEWALPGKHNALNLAAAAAAASTLNIELSEIEEACQGFEAPKGRSQIKWVEKSPIYCDYYNASPRSMRAGLESFSDLLASWGNPNVWLCLGDMLELGKDELALHQGLRESVLKFPNAKILLFGPRMKSLADALKGREVFHTEKMEELQKQLSQWKMGDAVFIKGSRGMKMERLLEVLKP